MEGLLFLALPLVVVAWACVFRNLLRPVDVRPARPLRKTDFEERLDKFQESFKRLEMAFAAMMVPAQTASENLLKFSRAFVKIGGAGSQTSPHADDKPAPPVLPKEDQEQ